MINKKNRCCSTCEAGHRSILACLNPAQMKQLLAHKQEREYRKGQVIFYVGDELQHVFCIHSGFVKLYKVDRSGREMVIRFLGAGDVLGYRPILSNEPSAAEAECVVTCNVCLIPRSQFNDWLAESPELSTSLLRKLARDLRESEELWLIHASESAEVRLAHFLCQLVELSERAPGTVNSSRITIPKTEIARAAGLTPSTLSRILAKFAQGGHIRLATRHFDIVHPDYFQLMIK